MECAVVIPTRGRPDYLRQAIESIERQSYPVAQVIVVLDGPDPDGRTVAETAGCEVVALDEPRGVSAARNAGVSVARSPWIAFLDDDDLWHPERLACTERYIRGHPSCRAVQAQYFTFGDNAGADLNASTLDECLTAAATVASDRLTDMSYLEIYGRSYELLLERNRGVISTATVHVDLVREVQGFDEALTCAEDWMLFLAIARHTEWHLIDRRLSFVRKHGANSTNVNPLNGLTTLRAISDVWQRRDPDETGHPALSHFGVAYRWTVQNAMWKALRRRDLRLARSIWRTGQSLLPRWADRAYVLVPPQVTWRVEHRRLR